jgi:hypothetical protein
MVMLSAVPIVAFAVTQAISRTSPQQCFSGSVKAAAGR